MRKIATEVQYDDTQRPSKPIRIPPITLLTEREAAQLRDNLDEVLNNE